MNSLPFQCEIQAIATDPPYGRSSSTHGIKIIELITNFLNEGQDLIKKKDKICFAVPTTAQIGENIDTKRLKIKEIHEYYVHKSLTRKIFVLEKK